MPFARREANSFSHRVINKSLKAATTIRVGSSSEPNKQAGMMPFVAANNGTAPKEAQYQFPSATIPG